MHLLPIRDPGHGPRRFGTPILGAADAYVHTSQHPIAAKHPDAYTNFVSHANTNILSHTDIDAHLDPATHT